MKIVKTLISFGLRQVIGDLADKGIDFVVELFTDETQALPKAVAAANARTWQALGVALAGDSLWEQFKRYALSDATERAVRQQLASFLRDNATAFQTHPEPFRKACLNDLNRLRRSGAFKPSHLLAAELRQQTAAWKHYTDPKDIINGAWDAVAGVAKALESEYPKLSRLLRQRVGDGPPLLAALFSFFLRQEIAKDRDLSAMLTFDMVGTLYAAQENAFLEVGQALATIGDKIDAILDQLDRIETVVVQTQATLLDITAEMQQCVGEMRRMHDDVIVLLHKQHMQRGVLSARHSLSIHSEAERNAVRGLLQQLRQLPMEQRRQVPALLNGLGKLLVGAGDFAEAGRTFAAALSIAPGDAARAEIHYNAYRAALEKPETWGAAFVAIQEAATLDSARFMLFPTHRYKPQRILGAGGFGTVFLCHDNDFDQQVVVKTLHTSDLERSLSDLFNEAKLLRLLHHPAIIGVHDDWGFADPVRQERPYIVMDYFEGMTLRAYVEKYCELTPEQYVDVAQQIVSGMKAAHRQGVLHRDLKPDNILVLRRGERFDVKIIDFGLAMPRHVVETSAVQPGAAQTVHGVSAVGTLAYSAPEQMGRLHGVEVDTYSDVYAFGKTSWFALFNLESPATPNRRHRRKISKDLTKLLETCTEYRPKDRYPDFEPVARHFDGGAQQHKTQTAVGEKKLVEVLRGIFESSGGKQANMNTSAAKAICREYSISEERGQEILQKSWEQWQQAHPTKMKPPPPPLPPSVAEIAPPKKFTNSLGMQFVLAPPATYWMGDRDKQQYVEIPHPFYIGVHPVTQGQWHALLGNNPSHFSRNGDGADKVDGISDGDLQLFPVEQVSWEDAQQFIEKLNTREPNPEWLYRLPTEAEWEYACRGGATFQVAFDFYFEQPTNDASSHQANFDGKYPYCNGVTGPFLKRTTKVGSYKPNRLGVFDMHGNVWEWCRDVFEVGASDRVFRGGGWNDFGADCRASCRIRMAPMLRRHDLGFRLVRVPSGQ